MRKSLQSFSVLLIYSLTVIALIVYLYGFFPLESITAEQKLSNRLDQKNENKPKHIQKLVFFVIDALRLDFVKSENNENYMPFVLSAIRQNKACLLSTKTHAPTVTLPRIKAITSGTVPSFFDVVLNFQSSSFNIDNFISQANYRGYRIVFYGDDTWLKLFPNHFSRYEGVNSFFASDYIEVDDNVTRNVENELKRKDWDIMILHYLGLDHIGHIEGPSSFLVRPKLREMDMVIQKIAQHLKKLESEKNIKTMLIVTGDHGMKDSGSHGGVTYSEITVPLVSIGKPCYQLPGWPNDYIPRQIDIAPTISLLLGLPTPASNIGKLIPSLLSGISINHILQELENIRKILLHQNNLLHLDFGDSFKNKLADLQKNITEALIKRVVNEYYLTLDQLSEAVGKSKTEFKLSFLFVSCFLLWVSSLLILLIFMIYLKPKKFSHWILILGTAVHAISSGSTSFIEEEHQIWYFFWITLCTSIVFETFDNFKIEKWFHFLEPTAIWIAICCSHRFLRKLNQTGDKWANLPDIHGYVSSPGKEDLLAVMFFAGLAALFWCCYSQKCSKLQTIIYAAALLTIVCYRLAVNSIHIGFIPYPTSRGSTEVNIFWFLLVIFFYLTIRNKKPLYLAWSLIPTLLLRPHNVILVPTEIMISHHIHKFFSKPKDNIWNSIAHVWLGQVFYFYQGNGNSIANLDVASGFIGLQEYEPVYASFTMEAHTCSGIILSFLLSPKSNLTYAALRIIPLSLYCTFLIFQLHHLFIWSVFSPKLLYEANHTIVIFFCIFISVIINIRS